MAIIKGRFSWILMVGGVLAGAAMAQQPPDVVTSDSNVNTAMGTAALRSNTTGFGNTAAGAYALPSNTTGNNNSAFGNAALFSNTAGSFNVATGGAALFSNTTGSDNVADGVNALGLNTTGFSNTASESAALFSNTTGSLNTASGYFALYSNTTGNYNTAFGQGVLYWNTSGGGNTATGSGALYLNTTGINNTASGFAALNANTTGNENAAVGVTALANSATGSNNTALGYAAGYNVIGGSNNIDIGNLGVASDNGTIRIGTAAQHVATFIAGIWGHSVRRGASVLINSNGQLGVEESSERYKTDIEPVEVSSEKLQRLRPVTYRFKTDSTGDRHYGLIAEEVDKVYPDLVIRDDEGNIEGVRYDELAPILLGEMQRQNVLIDSQTAQITDLKEQFAKLQEVSKSLQTALIRLQTEKLQVAVH